MGFTLPVTRTSKTPTATLEWTETAGLDPKTIPGLGVLLDIESEDIARHGGDRCIPIDRTHWCVGRVKPDGCVWRILPREVFAQLHHPAWLWIEDGWFDALHRLRGPRPEMKTLTQQLAQAQSIEPDLNTHHRLIAAAVSHIRHAKGPLAIILPEHAFATPGQPIRWLALALLSCLPPKQRALLRLSTAECRPNATQWDVVFTSERQPEFTCLDLDTLPETFDDPVAQFIVEQLNNGHADRAEAFAFMQFGESADPWASAAKRLNENEVHSTRDITPELVREYPSQALGHLLFLFAWGKPVHVPFARRITAYTLRTGDATPWQPLMSRSNKERILAVQHYLETPNKPVPSPGLLFSIAMARPKGTLIGPWCAALMNWAQTESLSEVCEHLILGVLYKDPMPKEPSSRASLWTLLLHRWIRQGRFDEAKGLFVHPATQRLLHSDIARVVAEGWLMLPRTHQSEDHMTKLIERMREVRDGDQAVARIVQQLHRTSRESFAHSAVRTWARVRCVGRVSSKDALMQEIPGTPFARTWVTEVARFASDTSLKSWVGPLAESSRDNLWARTEHTRSQYKEYSPYERICFSAALLPEGAAGLEQSMRTVLQQLSARELESTALKPISDAFAAHPASSPLWDLMGYVTDPAHPTDQLRTLVGILTKRAPQKNADRALCLQLLNTVGSQTSRTPTQHRVWFTALFEQLKHANEPFIHDLTTAIVRGIRQREGGEMHFVHILLNWIELGMHFDGLEHLLELTLKVMWPERVPDTYLTALNPAQWPPPAKRVWESALHLYETE